ncbi:MAG: PadR family transcriptional regulator [Alphaproteobacteria bacterium]|nr:PadR family transcriptional regulator [Alphaproteobacteria bacterium]
MDGHDHHSGRHRAHRHDAPRGHRDHADPGHGHLRHGRRGRGGRGGGVLDPGDLRYVLLHLIAERPRHGYELIKAIEESFAGTYTPSPGVIYPTLTLLEDLGYLDPQTADGTRKLYAVTEAGTAFLAANRAVVDAILARMAAAGRAHSEGPAPEIRRALRNLEAALSIRLGRGPLDGEQARTVAATLDHAAGEIERG